MKNQSLLVGAAVGGLFVLAIIGVFVTTKQENCRDFSQGLVQVGGQEITVAVAKDGLEQARGLAGCTKIPVNAGMYFPYEGKQTPTFWMKGMRIPIDIIWIADNEVVGILEFVPPPTTKLDEELPRYRPSRPITAVLEINAGATKKFGITEGDSVRFIANK